MRKFNNTEFAEGIKLPFAKFKELFKGIFSEEEMEKAYKIAVDERYRSTPKKSNKTKKS